MITPHASPTTPRRGPALLFVLAAAALILVAPSPATALAALLRASTDPTRPLVAAVGLCAWGCACWLLTCTALTAAGRLLPGVAGRTARALAVRCAPRAVRRVAELAVGVTVATAVLGGTGAFAAEGLRSAVGAARVSLSDTTPVPAPQLAPPMDLDWPAAPSMVADAAARSAPTSPATTRFDARSPIAVVPVRRTAPEVVVQSGDCLWDLARASLGPAASDQQVAAAWPSWWSANRALIGDDPDLLQPGMHLAPPTTRARSAP